jgi:uncharacterized protein YndB with AHSA1/START domain
MKTVLVIGAQGVLGGLTAEIFRAEGWNVLCGGRRVETAADFRRVDLDRSETFAAACRGVDVVVSAVEDPDCRAERHVLENGGAILTMASSRAADRDRLAASVTHPKGTAIFNAGYSGLTAIAVKDLLAKYPAADTVLYAGTMSLKATMGRGGVLFGHRVLTSGSRRATRTFDFGARLGRLTCLEVDLSDERWIDPAILGARAAAFYVTLAEQGVFRMFRWLDRLGLLARLPASWVRPRPPKTPRIEHATAEPMATWLGASRDGQLFGSTTLSTKGDYLTTARIAEKMAGLVLAAACRPGAFTVDTWFDWKDIAPAAAAIGVEWVMADTTEVRRVVSASREIASGAQQIFELIADPAQQPRWDGNDNLAEARAGQRVRAAGDIFLMTLTIGLNGNNIRENHVVEFEEGRRIAWLPSEPGQEPPGHLWRWELEPLDEAHTRVTHTYDWSGLTDQRRLPRARATTVDKLQASLDRLAELAER